jgi:urea carboxylase
LNRPFSTLLVANRGEIACRVLKSAAALGLRTVAVYSDADRGAAHVSMADVAVRIGPAPARESYLRVDRVLDAAASTGAGAIHPGYGMFAEDPEAARTIEAAGLVFLGPTVAQLSELGAKDRARRLAGELGLDLLPGTGVLESQDMALAEAASLGYPVMLKAVGGGGGLGLAVCSTPSDLLEAWPRIERLQAAVGGAAAYLESYVEHGRHLEVQVFGDGNGRVLVLGDRDCTLQRRHQKVVEEAPAPNLPPAVRERILGAARTLAGATRYRSAGTVEFFYDVDRGRAAFLEVNPRLQVEHTVTEEVHGIDLVAWMIRLGLGDTGMFDQAPPTARGHSIQARVYAENAGGHASPGLLTRVELPGDVRVDGWAALGTEVTAAYDPLLAKLVVTGADRGAAIDALIAALAKTRIDGVRTNVGLLRGAVASPLFAAAAHTTGTLAQVTDSTPRVEVLRAGRETTVQDWPGRLGLWRIGVPPSGPMDDRSFRCANRAVGNPEGMAGLECLLDGPRLRFSRATTVCVGGAATPVTVDGASAPQFEPIVVPAGGELDVGAATGAGLRTYVAVAGGLDVPEFHGSRATFTLGGFGGHAGRPLREGDALALGDPVPAAGGAPGPAWPEIVHDWTVRAVEGPHAAPEFFTTAAIETFYDTTWEIHFNSARTGIRLLGPAPEWARADGGDAGLHPSNIHDTAYSVGAVDYTGDTPIVLGPDGPSLGGFVCPATIVLGDQWMLGQLRPGDTLRFEAVSDDAPRRRRTLRPGREPLDHGVLARTDDGPGPAVTYRRSGDTALLIEFGPMEIDLALRLRVGALEQALGEEQIEGITDVTAGIRSLQIQFDPDRHSARSMVPVARALVDRLPDVRELALPSRTVRLPLSWNDPAAQLAVERYGSGVRGDAPWCPSNIEFIRRINGLGDVEDVRRIVLGAEYLLMGLGDIYLGAPVTIPLDPRHRLVTTKYNPARTWTPENAVGIGGAYLAIYGMEGPGGYQLVGRTVQVWNRYAQGPAFEPGTPWLLRHFDRIRWFEVSAEELLDRRADVAAGRAEIEIAQGSLDCGEYFAFLEREADGIAAFQERRQAAFAAERAAWQAAGEFDAKPEPATVHATPGAAREALPPGTVVRAPLASSVWRVDVEHGDTVRAGELLVTLEAMKMETPIEAPHDGLVAAVLVRPGELVSSGADMVVIEKRP